MKSSQIKVSEIGEKGLIENPNPVPLADLAMTLIFPISQHQLETILHLQTLIWMTIAIWSLLQIC